MGKRAFSDLLGLMFVILLLSGCAASNENASTKEGVDDAGKETIEFHYWASAAGEEAAFNDLIKKFESENPKIKIKASQVPSPANGEYYPKLQTQFAAGNAPDVFRTQYQKIGEFTSENALLDVSDLFEKDKGSYNPSLLKAVTNNEKIFGLPHHTDTLAVFYNKTYLDKLGVKAPDTIGNAWTWEEFFDIAKEIKDKKLAPHGIAMNWQASTAYRSLPFFYQNNAALLTENFKKGNADTTEAVESLSTLKKMYKDYMSPGNSMKGSDDFNMLFTSGNAGLFISGNWMIPKFESEMKDFEWGVTYMPQNKAAASDLGGNALAISADTKHSTAAKKFLSYMGEKENIKLFVEKGLFLPGRTDIGKLDYQLKNPEMMDLFIQQSSTIPENLAETVTSEKFAGINQVLADTLEDLFISDKSPEKAAENLNKEINDILKE